MRGEMYLRRSPNIIHNLNEQEHDNIQLRESIKENRSGSALQFEKLNKHLSQMNVIMNQDNIKLPEKEGYDFQRHQTIQNFVRHERDQKTTDQAAKKQMKILEFMKKNELLILNYPKKSAFLLKEFEKLPQRREKGLILMRDFWTTKQYKVMMKRSQFNEDPDQFSQLNYRDQNPSIQSMHEQHKQDKLFHSLAQRSRITLEDLHIYRNNSIEQQNKRSEEIQVKLEKYLVNDKIMTPEKNKSDKNILSHNLHNLRLETIEGGRRIRKYKQGQSTNAINQFEVQNARIHDSYKPVNSAKRHMSCHSNDILGDEILIKDVFRFSTQNSGKQEIDPIQTPFKKRNNLMRINSQYQAARSNTRTSAEFVYSSTNQSLILKDKRLSSRCVSMEGERNNSTSHKQEERLAFFQAVAQKEILKQEVNQLIHNCEKEHNQNKGILADINKAQTFEDELKDSQMMQRRQQNMKTLRNTLFRKNNSRFERIEKQSSKQDGI